MVLELKAGPDLFGADGAGIVEAVGQSVTKFKPGDEVFALFGGRSKGAAFQEVATVSEASVSLKPKGVSFEEVASLPLDRTFIFMEPGCFTIMVSSLYRPNCLEQILTI